jgi:hypothetical protein
MSAWTGASEVPVSDLAVASPWFTRSKVDDVITLLIEPHVHPLLQCNIWHMRGRNRPLLGEIEGADIDAYVDTMLRLRRLTVETVHGGHGPSMDRRRFHEIIDDYLDKRMR